VSADGKVVRRLVSPTERGPLAGLGKALQNAMTELLGDRQAPRPIAIGVGMRGIVDLDSQMLCSTSLFPNDEHYDLRLDLEEVFGLPVRLSNDVKAAAVAEFVWGVGRHRSSFTYLAIGTGMGAASFDHGRLLRGARDTAGEICRYVFTSDGRLPARHLESFVSGEGFDDELRRLAPEHPTTVLQDALALDVPVTSVQLFDACAAGDPLAKTVVDDAVFKLAQVLVNFEATVGSGCFVFGGGAVSGADWFVQRVMDSARQLCEEANVEWAATAQITELGADDIGLLGAAAVALCPEALGGSGNRTDDGHKKE